MHDSIYADNAKIAQTGRALGEIELLSHTIDNLRGAITQLEGQLTPVLRSQPEPDGMIPVRSADSTIEDLRLQLDDQNGRIVVLTDRITL